MNAFAKTKRLGTILLAGWIATLAATAFGDGEKDLSKLDLSKLPPPAQKQGVTYEKDIHPLLEASCIRCHGDRKPKADLRLDSRDAALKGSENGKVIKPGDSKHSLLVIAAARIDDDTAMPPKRKPGAGGPFHGGWTNRPPADGGSAQPERKEKADGPGNGPRMQGPPPKPLTAEEVGLLRAWIDQGAK